MNEDFESDDMESGMPNAGLGGSGAEGGEVPKKGLQDMSKDELVAKCKSLLTLAQKAKSAKDGEFFCCFWFRSILVLNEPWLSSQCPILSYVSRTWKIHLFFFTFHAASFLSTKFRYFFRNFAIDFFCFSDAVNALKESTSKSEALQEMVENLSQQKVENISECEQLKKHLQKANQEKLQLQENLDKLGKKFGETETEKQVQER